MARADVLARGVAAAVWPARLQRLRGALAALLPQGSELWLDGAHNPGGAEILAAQLAAWGTPTTLVLGMKQSKDVAEFLAILAPHAAAIYAVAEPEQHLALPVEKIIEASGGKAVPGPGCARCFKTNTAPNAGANLRQPVSGRRSAETRRAGLRLYRLGRSSPNSRAQFCAIS